MAVAVGTNAGFLETAPVADPSDGVRQISAVAGVQGDTSDATATTITEVGWYCSNATEESNFEVGLYAADGATVPGEAGTLLESNTTNAKGTTEGWKAVTGLNWSISSSTNYWIGIQVDATSPATNVDYRSFTLVTPGSDRVSNATLPNPFGGGAWATYQTLAIYAIWEAEAPEPTATAVNIGDTFNSIASWAVNVSDTFQTITSGATNVGDTWQTITLA